MDRIVIEKQLNRDSILDGDVVDLTISHSPGGLMRAWMKLSHRANNIEIGLTYDELKMLVKEIECFYE